MSIITSFRAGLAFFTRIPVGAAPLPPTLSGVVAWLPAVGLLVGALAALVLLPAARLGLPAPLCGIGAALVWTCCASIFRRWISRRTFPPQTPAVWSSCGPLP